MIVKSTSNYTSGYFKARRPYFLIYFYVVSGLILSFKFISAKEYLAILSTRSYVVVSLLPLDPRISLSSECRTYERAATFS
jgi:hypothetical protein